MAMQSPIRPGPVLLAALRDLRAPLVALAVMTLLFQSALPLAAAEASPQAVAALSICLGAGDEPDDRSHSGACLCGQVCLHGGCLDCSAAAGRDLPGLVHPRLPAPWIARTGEPVGLRRHTAARSRAPPVCS